MKTMITAQEASKRATKELQYMPKERLPYLEYMVQNAVLAGLPSVILRTNLDAMDLAMVTQHFMNYGYVVRVDVTDSYSRFDNLIEIIWDYETKTIKTEEWKP